jgi:hypothetical protein
MPSYCLTHDAKELVVKRNKYIFIIYGILWIGMLAQPIYNFDETAALFKRNPITSTAIYLLVIGAAVWLGYGILSHRVKLVINKRGLWTRRSKLVTWDNLYYYYFIKGKHQNQITWTFKFKTVAPEREFTVDMFFFDNDHEDIIKAIEDNSYGNTVHYLGVDDYS